jgi:malate dehydrogenase (oxaloacetate-decarboxylating)
MREGVVREDEPGGLKREGRLYTMETIPSASYSMTLRVEFPHRPGALAEVLAAVGGAGGLVGAVDIVRMGQERSIRDVTVNARDSEHGRQIVDTVEAMPETRVITFSDRTFRMHQGGKIEVRAKTQIRSRDDLSMAYTPGVARVCLAIAEDPESIQPDDQEEHRGGRHGRDGGPGLGEHRA